LNPFAIIIRKIRSFFRLPIFQQCWVLPIWALLGISKLLIHLIPFKYVAPKLGYHIGTKQWLPLLDQQQQTRAIQISRVVKLASRYTPWESNCFPQAVTARVLLGVYKIPYALYFGLESGPETHIMNAHAWVTAGRVTITGGTSFQKFTSVGCFIAPQCARHVDQ